LTAAYRPSGSLEWLASKLGSVSSWSVIGTISVEERSLSSIAELKRIGKLGVSAFFQIEPSLLRQPNRFRISTISKLAERQREALAIAPCVDICHIELLCRETKLISACLQRLKLSKQNIIIDISSMPKRFFFPLVALALRSGNFENVMVTYTSPAKYGDPLAEDPLPWDALPMFGATDLQPGKQKLIIGVGYQSLRLREIVEGADFSADNVELLFPVATNRGYLKNWEFVRQVYQELGPLPEASIKRVSANNVSNVFDRLVAITNNGVYHSVLAPYGPKPVSLAMCLFGIWCQDMGVPVKIGYTQPQVYSDEYSKGQSLTPNGLPEVHAFCLRVEGRNLYEA